MFCVKLDHAVGEEFQILSICRLFNKLVLEAPLITESALEVIRRYCEDEVGHRHASFQSFQYIHEVMEWIHLVSA